MTGIPQRIKPSRSYFMVIGVVGLVSLGMCSLFIFAAFYNNYYPEGFTLGMGIVFAGLVIALLGSGLYLTGDVLIYPDRIEKYTLSGKLHKSFLLADVIKWRVFVSKKSASQRSLKITHRHGTYKVTTWEDAYQPVYETILREEQRRGTTLNDTPNAEIKKRRTEYTIVTSAWLLIAVLIMLGGIQTYRGDTKRTRYGNPAYIQGIVTEKHRAKGQRFGIKIKGQPHFRFYTESSEMRDLINIGDTVELGLDSITYLKKITRQIPLTFSDKYFGYSLINPISLATGEWEITKPNSNGTPPDKSTGSIIMAIAGLLLLPIFWLFFRLWRGDTMEHFFKRS